MLILKQGFREGVAGFIVAVLGSYYVFLKYAKLWELESRAWKDAPVPQPASCPEPGGAP